MNRFGALVERNFRLFFGATTISAIGDGVASIALVFALLHISNKVASPSLRAVRRVEVVEVESVPQAA